MRNQFLFLAAASLVSAQGFSADWDAAYTKAKTALGKLSQNEKLGLVSGVGWGKGACAGNTAAANSIGYGGLCLQDGPLGVRDRTGITAFPPGIQAASTWDRDLIRQRGKGIGAQTKALGIHVILGPVAGPLGQFPEGGRNWEGFGNDPYLCGVSMEQTVGGIQEAGAQACAKHYIGNEQEKNRDTMNAVIDDRTFHELYLWPFAEAVRANVASIMCSYNKISGKWACENQQMLDAILKKELGFRGYVVTDWDAQHTTVDSANAGLDMTMPGSNYGGMNVLWNNGQLSNAVNNRQVPQARLDDMVTRILAAWYLTKQDSGYPRVVTGGSNVQTTADKNLAKAVARDGIVLLKNEDILPLVKPRSIAIIGSHAVSNPRGINSCGDMGCNTGALSMGWGSGTATLPYLSAPADAISSRARQEGSTVTTTASDNSYQGASAAQNADVAIVFITADSGEEYITVENNKGDRNDLNAWHAGNELVKAVANVNRNTIVVVHSVGPILLESFADLPNVKAIVWAGLPGQESGNALVEVLYGDVSPSGKLPYTIAKRASDYGTSIQATTDNFSEGLYIDYRYLDKNNIAPRYEFGFGLSYTTFNYTALSITSTATSGPATGATVPGGASSLFDTVATITATITNSGPVPGAEVAQLYLGLPSSAPATPVRQLRGFEKQMLQVGESASVTFELRRKDLSYWDVGGKRWVLPAGSFRVEVGGSSRDLRLSGMMTVA
ncbi:glycoside hydrolase superfamily [Amylocarpus encephaloides]|uniref:beta-glucosidase n=1 Tax=Amylocarpus encephaloides TaxID=45428 RepID=A0A9P8C2X7_9HELO|nr:glycoside hydrolase superfamily [Amylocarpus encephaloides]